MKRVFTVAIFLIFSLTSFSQLSGNIKNDKRALTQEGDYTIKSHISGKVTFQISVNIQGEITSAKILDSESTVRSTPAKIEARNYLTSNFKFAAGTWYPKYHQGKITFTLIEE